METNDVNIDSLLSEIAALKSQIFEANNIINAIREGSVDALVIQKEGKSQIYSMESADFTYRILVEKFNEGALSITEEGLILYCNDYFSKLIGIPANHIVGTYLNLYVDNQKAFELLMLDLKIAGISKGEIKLNIMGRKIPVYMSFTNLRPTVASVGVVVTDLTEKKKHEEALEKYQQRLEIKIEELNHTNLNLKHFIHVISHDIKEPLRKIMIYISRMKIENNNPIVEIGVHSINRIKYSALRLNSLVDDLVRYASSSQKVNQTEICLNEVLQEVTEDLEVLIQETRARIASDNLPRIKGSKVQLRQVFSNLISNAIKYRKPNIDPQITISNSIQIISDNYKGKKRFHKICIEDNGIGMDEKYFGKIFTIFQRLHLQHEYSGNGVGLAICKKIMENHSGRIEVKSKLNEGSFFILLFPVDPN